MSDLVYDTTFPDEPAWVAKPDAKPLCHQLAIAPKPIEPLMACSKCNGSGHSLSKGFSYFDETSGKRKSFPSVWKQCMYCNGDGWFHAPDISLLIKAVTGRKPKTLRSKRPDDTRSYYVWRLARFHGGKDVCLPMMAEMDIAGDPYRDLLDTLARLIAQAYFGSGNVGTARWHQAMYGSHNFKDVPSCIDGPVYDSDKPEEEFLETV